MYWNSEAGRILNLDPNRVTNTLDVLKLAKFQSYYDIGDGVTNTLDVLKLIFILET